LIYNAVDMLGYPLTILLLMLCAACYQKIGITSDKNVKL